MMYENIDTPKSSIADPKSLSVSLLGQKSPKPTVDNDVNAKYIEIVTFSIFVLE